MPQEENKGGGSGEKKGKGERKEGWPSFFPFSFAQKKKKTKKGGKGGKGGGGEIDAQFLSPFLTLRRAKAPEEKEGKGGGRGEFRHVLQQKKKGEKSCGGKEDRQVISDFPSFPEEEEKGSKKKKEEKAGDRCLI